MNRKPSPAANGAEGTRTHQEAMADRAQKEAWLAGELRQLEYVASLHPRERANLAPWAA